MKSMRIWWLALSLFCGTALRAAFPPDTIATDTLVQSIRYQAPNAGEVFLAWKPYQTPPLQLLDANPGSRLVDDLLCTPLQQIADAFEGRIRLPEGEEYYYCFWVTRGSDGNYRDYWDIKSGAEAKADGGTLSVAGTPEPSELMTEWVTETFGIWLLAGLLLLYALIRGLLGGVPRAREAAYVDLIFATGLSAGFLHLLARALILDFAGVSVLRRPLHILGRILGAGLEDLVIVSTLTAIAFGLSLTAGRRGKAVITTAFLVVMLFLSVVAFANVEMIRYLGDPFTYQWLYYSDFLKGPSAWAALGENASPVRLFNLIALGLSVIVLARMLTLPPRWLPSGSASLFLPLLLTAMLGGSLLARQTVHLNARPGQRANAVAAFVRSMLESDAPDTFARMDLGPQDLPFRESITPAPHAGGPVAESRIKNVLVVVLESTPALYFDGPQAYPQITEPLEAFAGDYRYFDRIYAHAPSTNCTMVSLLTGLYPKLNYESVTRKYTTYPFASLPSELKAAGYRTSFFTSGDLEWQSADRFLEHREFDTVEDYQDIACARDYHLESSTYRASEGIDDDCLVDRLNDWLDEGKGKPFFSMLWTVQTHYPYYFDGAKTDFGVVGVYEDRYLNALRHGTRAVSAVLENLRDRGLDSTTLVVVTGDHGEAFGQHGHQGHGNTLYEEDLRVPLYLIHPGTFSGGTDSGLGGVKDLPTTILSLLNRQAPDSWQGRDLLNSSTDEGFYFSPWTQLYFAYRKGNRKYIFNESNRSVQVFDLAADPGEKNDLSGQVPADDLRAARLRIAAWVQHQNSLYESLP